MCSQNSFVFNTLTSRSLSFKKLLECLGEDWDGGNDSFVETTAPKSEADMRAWSLPEDLTEAQLCVRFLQSDKKAAAAARREDACARCCALARASHTSRSRKVVNITTAFTYQN